MIHFTLSFIQHRPPFLISTFRGPAAYSITFRLLLHLNWVISYCTSTLHLCFDFYTNREGTRRLRWIKSDFGHLGGFAIVLTAVKPVIRVWVLGIGIRVLWMTRRIDHYVMGSEGTLNDVNLTQSNLSLYCVPDCLDQPPEMRLIIQNNTT